MTVSCIFLNMKNKCVKMITDENKRTEKDFQKLQKSIFKEQHVILSRNSEHFIQCPLYNYQIVVASSYNLYKIMKMLFH